MKNKGVLLTILLILILGLGITFQIHRFVTEGTDEASAVSGQATASEAGDIPMEAASGVMSEALLKEAASELTAGAVRAAGARNSTDSSADSAAPVEAFSGTEEKMFEEPMEAAEDDSVQTAENGVITDSGKTEEHLPAAASSVSVSSDMPATYEEAVSKKAGQTESRTSAEAAVSGPSVAKTDGPGAENYYLLEETVTYEDFQKKLEEADNIMEEMRESNLSSNTDSLKMTAEYEYRLWDTELNRIYQAVIGLMSEKEAELLRTEERQWIRDRDRNAKQAAGKFKGGTMESLEYTASLANSTRERAYEILEEYGYLLPRE